VADLIVVVSLESATKLQVDSYEFLLGSFATNVAEEIEARLVVAK
jgi:hypothetical protein